MSEALTKLLEAVQTTTPTVYQAMLDRTMANAYATLGWGVALLAAGLSAWPASRKIVKEVDPFDRDLSLGICFVVGWIIAAMGLACLTDALITLATPEASAIREVAKLVKIK